MGQDGTGWDGSQGLAGGMQSSCWRVALGIEGSQGCRPGGAAPMGAQSLPEGARAETLARGSGWACCWAGGWQRTLGWGLCLRGGLSRAAVDFAACSRPGSTFPAELPAARPPGAVSSKLHPCKCPSALSLPVSHIHLTFNSALFRLCLLFYSRLSAKRKRRTYKHLETCFSLVGFWLLWLCKKWAS